MVFLLAPRLHLAMKHVMNARRNLKTKSVFNLLGPLTNPLGATVQLVGVFDAGRTEMMAETLQAVGSRRVYVVAGSDGIDEITTLALVPQIVDAVAIPVFAAGGIADGRGMAAAFALGAEAVQVGTRFAATVESSAHPTYKRLVAESPDGGTVLTMRRLFPVRMLKTPFAGKAVDAERRGATREEMEELLGSKREMLGIFEGNVDEGMFEAGQSAGLVRDTPHAAEIVRRLMDGYYSTCERMARTLA